MTIAQLNIMHLAALSEQLPQTSSRGTFGPGRPLELGPAPTDLPEEIRTPVIAQLVEADFLTPAGDLTTKGHTVLDPLVNYDAAFFGIILQRNKRQPVEFDIDDRWIQVTSTQHGDIRDSLRINTPRVYLHLSKVGSTLSCAVRNGQDVSITQGLITTSFAAAAADWAWRVCDPDGIWSPAPVDSVALPYAALAGVPGQRPIDPDGDKRARYDQYSRQYTRQLRESWGLDPRTTNTLQKILGYDHVASMQLMYTEGAHRDTTEHSLTYDFFHNAGATTTYPKTIADGTVWKQIAPATSPHRREAFTALSAAPRVPVRPITDGTAGNPTADQFMRR